MATKRYWRKAGRRRFLRRCKEHGYAAVVVLGHPDYYPRFGFVPSANLGIKSEYKAPLEAFMVKELEIGALEECKGTIKYHQKFKEIL